ncbi:hypothetical protein BEH_07820 [Priestia filamentosa]|uniref:Uncharacterized protein n=1 Tax=Priestia filamentosa TaxID=1402861 RepID=A0A0H4KD20_9BACI|nr:hypothetical protein [Priestia filamentosa]AKO92017.1 hypothetical protein BEH_07820 [Priestia filamentosa]
MIGDKKFIEAVTEELMDTYRFTYQEATKMINEYSVIKDLLKSDPEFVYHYHPLYWANHTFESYSSCKNKSLD